MSSDVDSAGHGGKLRIALLSFAHVHAESYARLLSARDDVELVVADPDGVSSEREGPRGEELARSLGLASAASYEEVFAWRPHAVVVTAETSRHDELVTAALAAGAHVLCEKPLATDAAHAEAFATAAERAGVVLMTAYPVRFAPEYAELKRMVETGRLGEILGIRGTNNGKIPSGRSWFTDAALAGGGALVDHVVHCADLIDDLLGEQPETVRAVSNAIIGRAGREPAGRSGGEAPDGEVPDGVAPVETAGLVTMTFGSGVIATIDCSWTQPDAAARWGDLTLQVIGTKGTATIAPFESGLPGEGTDGATWVPAGPDLDALMVDEFLSAIRTGRQPQPDAGAGVRTLRIVAAAQESARTGEVVTLR
jgi:predicted dehydrogenase